MTSTPPSGAVVLNQKYQLGRQLGAGGMGTVYWARHLVLQREVAVKLLTPELMNSRPAVERFLREARALAAVDHPGVCHIFDADTDPQGVPFLVMELLDGQTLDSVVKRAPQTSLDERVRWIIKAAEGLGAAHERGIVHRDVKPSNLMLTRTGVKVLDFGVAKAAFDRNKELTGDNAVGTAQYMAPEQLMGEPVDPRCDVWALAVTLYRLLSGKLPFEGVTAVSYMKSVMDGEVVSLSARGVAVSPGVWAALERALRPLAQRTPSVAQFAAELSAALDATASADVTVSSPRLPQSTPPRRGVAGALLALVAVVSVAGVGVAWWIRSSSETALPRGPHVTPNTALAPGVTAPGVDAPAVAAPAVAPAVAPESALSPPSPAGVVGASPRPVVRPKAAPTKKPPAETPRLDAENPDRL